jgi:hypothetical protein
MARNREKPIVEVSRKLAPRIDDRVSNTQEAVKKQQERDINITLKTHRA